MGLSDVIFLKRRPNPAPKKGDLHPTPNRRPSSHLQRTIPGNNCWYWRGKLKCKKPMTSEDIEGSHALYIYLSIFLRQAVSCIIN